MHLLRFVHARARHRTDLRAIYEEDDGHRRQRKGQEAQKRSGPVDAEVVIHGSAEERETGAKEAADEGVGRDGAVGVEQIDVDDVLEALDEDDEHASPDGNGRHCLRDPACARVACPGEPEEADWEDDGAEDHGLQASLWHNFAWGASGLGGEDGQRVRDDAYEAAEYPDKEADENKGC